jgi:hypothetical protein
MDRIINMLISRVLGRLINRGVDAGIARVTRGSGRELTPEQEAQARQTSRTAKQAIRVARRVGRF